MFLEEPTAPQTRHSAASRASIRAVCMVPSWSEWLLVLDSVARAEKKENMQHCRMSPGLPLGPEHGASATCPTGLPADDVGRCPVSEPGIRKPVS